MDQLSPGDALSRLKQLITNGRYGQNYTYMPSEKNNLLLETYHIDENKRKDIILSLELSDHIKDEYSNDTDHPDDYIYVFIKRGVSLLPRFYKELHYEKIDIYVKFFFCNEDSSVAVILSFHEAGDF